MNISLEQLFGAAKEISLSSAERGLIRSHLEKEINSVRTSSIQRQNEYMTQSSHSTPERGVELTPAEREAMRLQLRAFMAKHPVLEPSSFSSFVHNFFLRAPAFATAFVGVFAVGGIAFAAESSVPGDTLYPIKIHVNEAVMAQLQAESDTDPLWQTKLLERRSAEVRRLAARKDVSENQWFAMERVFEKNVEHVEVAVKQLPPAEAILVEESIAEIAQTLDSAKTEKNPSEGRIIARIKGLTHNKPTIAAVLEKNLQQDQRGQTGGMHINTSAAAEAKVQSTVKIEAPAPVVPLLNGIDASKLMMKIQSSSVLSGSGSSHSKKHSSVSSDVSSSVYSSLNSSSQTPSSEATVSSQSSETVSSQAPVIPLPVPVIPPVHVPSLPSGGGLLH